MIDKRPAAIAYCVDEADVAAAVRYGIEHGLPIAVRGGGHNGGGLGSVDDGLVIDLSEMSDDHRRRRRTHGARRRRCAAQGCPRGDARARPYRAVGIIGTTGVGGLTLGGGMGHLTRALGLTIDNLVAATVVLADGSIVQTDAEREPDLFWALRGGGGNFGVVTSFSFRCHPVTTVLAGPVLYDIGDAAELLAWYRDFLPAAPDEVSGFFAFLSVPPGPPFPEELHLRKVCAVVWTQAGEEESDALREARSFGTPLLDGVAPMPLPVWNTAFDAVYPPGDQWYWRGEFVREIPDEAIAVHAEYGPAMPTWKSTMHLYAIDGAASRVGERRDRVGVPRRDLGAACSRASIPIRRTPARSATGRSRIPTRSSRTGWAAATSTSRWTSPIACAACTASNYDRLARIKAQYDPDNVFRVNQNIAPAA